jgi:nucleotide-binding universal stress UspA family protein
VRASVVGVDGSANAARAAICLAALRPRRGERVTVVRVEEPMSLPSGALLPRGIRATLRREVAALNAERMARAKRDVGKVAARRARSGRAVRERVYAGAPLDALLATVSATRADVLVVGARGVSGVSRLLLGSVAEGALSRSPIPVLVVR